MSTDNKDAVRVALEALLTCIDDAFDSYERFGGICKFEDQPMIPASTLTEIVDLRGALHVATIAAAPAHAAHAAQAERIEQLEKGLRLSAEDHDDTAHIISSSAPKDNVLRSIALKAKFARAFLSGQPVQQPGDVRDAAVVLWNGTGEQLQKADDTLRSLSSYVGQGGCWDTENLDYDEIEKRIKEGIDTITKVESGRTVQPGADLQAAIMALMPKCDDSTQFVCGYLQARNDAARLAASRPLAPQPAQPAAALVASARPSAELSATDQDQEDQVWLEMAQAARDGGFVGDATAAQLAAPQGWKLVPLVPTPKMIEAAAKADDEGFEDGRSHGASGREIYDAMLAAAPVAQPATPGEAHQWSKGDILQIFAENSQCSENGDQHGYSIVYERHALAIAAALLGASTATPVPAQQSKPTDDRFSFELAARKGLPLQMTGIDFQRNDDDDYKWAATRSLYGFWKTARAAASAVPAPQAGQSDAARDVLAERQRQVEREGWTPAHDDAYSHDQLPRAAAAYAFPELTAVKGLQVWPWADSWFKPRDARRNYVRAGALILAEIERLDRAASARGAFRAPLQRASEIVATWPAWKKGSDRATPSPQGAENNNEGVK